MYTILCMLSSGHPLKLPNTAPSRLQHPKYVVNIQPYYSDLQLWHKPSLRYNYVTIVYLLS